MATDDRHPVVAGGDGARLLDTTFARLALCAGLYFLAMGATFPVLPRYVRDELGGSDTAVGMVLGAMAIGAIVARPAIGRLGDRRGRVVLLVLGAAVSAVALTGHLVADQLGPLVALRILFGMGQGALIVGATTMAVDLSPPHRSGEATSYVFVALHVGTATGSLVGEWILRRWSFDAVWIVAAATMAVAGAVAASLPRRMPDVGSGTDTLGMFHPKAVVPGAILGIGTLGFIGFSAFVPLHADDLGIENVGPFFAAASLTIVAIRGFGARLPDRLGARRGGTLALTLATTGLVLIGAWRSALGLAVGTIVMAAGTALLLPSLVTAAVDGVRPTERSRALATYTLFLELSAAFGAVLFGAVASVSTYGAAFLASGGFAAVALVWTQFAFSPPAPTVRTDPAPGRK